MTIYPYAILKLWKSYLVVQDKRVLIFFLLLEKQCFVIILKSLLLIPSTSGLEIGFNTTILDFTFGEGLNEFECTFLST